MEGVQGSEKTQSRFKAPAFAASLTLHGLYKTCDSPTPVKQKKCGFTSGMIAEMKRSMRETFQRHFSKIKRVLLPVGISLLCGCVSVPPKRALISPPPAAINLQEPLLLSSPLFGVKVLELPMGAYRQSYQNDAAIYYKTDSGQIRFEQKEKSKLKSGGICYQKKDGRFFAYWEISTDERKENERLVAPGIAAIDSATQPIRRRIYGDTDNVERTFLAWIWEESIQTWKFE